MYDILIIIWVICCIFRVDHLLQHLLWSVGLLQDLLNHIEKGMGKKLAFRCSDAVNASVQSSQQDMMGTRDTPGPAFDVYTPAGDN